VSGVQSVLNHLRFARHWLAKAENEFQRQESVQGELSLSLVEAEVRKAWTESRRTMRLLAFPGRAGQTGRPARAALGIGLALLAVVLGGVGVLRLAKPAVPTRLWPPSALPGTASREVGPVAPVADLPPRPVPSPKPRIAVAPEAPAASAVRVAEPAGPLERWPRQAGEPPAARAKETEESPEAAQPSRVEVAEAPALSPPLPVPAEPVPVTAAPAILASVVPAPAVARVLAAPPAAPDAREAPPVPAASEPPAARPPSRPEAHPVVTPVAAPITLSPASPAPAPAIAGEEGGTPLPLDLVELVRIAERSLTGRP
jgi:hypothetical protein